MCVYITSTGILLVHIRAVVLLPVYSVKIWWFPQDALYSSVMCVHPDTREKARPLPSQCPTEWNLDICIRYTCVTHNASWHQKTTLSASGNWSCFLLPGWFLLLEVFLLKFPPLFTKLNFRSSGKRHSPGYQQCRYPNSSLYPRPMSPAVLPERTARPAAHALWGGRQSYGSDWGLPSCHRQLQRPNLLPSHDWFTARIWYSFNQEWSGIKYKILQ